MRLCLAGMHALQLQVSSYTPLRRLLTSDRTSGMARTAKSSTAAPAPARCEEDSGRVKTDGAAKVAAHGVAPMVPWVRPPAGSISTSWATTGWSDAITLPKAQPGPGPAVGSCAGMVTRLLALLAVAGPAVTALRALWRGFCQISGLGWSRLVSM